MRFRKLYQLWSNLNICKTGNKHLFISFIASMHQFLFISNDVSKNITLNFVFVGNNRKKKLAAGRLQPRRKQKGPRKTIFFVLSRILEIFKVFLLISRTTWDQKYIWNIVFILDRSLFQSFGVFFWERFDCWILFPMCQRVENCLYPVVLLV